MSIRTAALLVLALAASAVASPVPRRMDTSEMFNELMDFHSGSSLERSIPVTVRHVLRDAPLTFKRNPSFEDAVGSPGISAELDFDDLESFPGASLDDEGDDVLASPEFSMDSEGDDMLASPEFSVDAEGDDVLASPEFSMEAEDDDMVVASAEAAPELLDDDVDTPVATAGMEPEELNE